MNYETESNVAWSDHKPVFAQFRLSTRIDEQKVNLFLNKGISGICQKELKIKFRSRSYGPNIIK